MAASRSDGNASPNSLNLVNSSRLKSLASGNLAQSVKSPSCRAEQGEDDRSRLQQAVEQRLDHLLGRLPQVKAGNLFRIRFGMSLTDFRALPIEQAAAVLGVADDELKGRRSKWHRR